MFWDILEIEETTNTKEIMDAYRKKLLVTNPEDKPEEFKQLRQAFEQALDYAKNHTETKEKSDIELWKEKLEDLYTHFQRRIQLEEWKKLLNEDICQSLDTKMMVEETLLNFLTENYHLPHEIWVYLNEVFSLLERKEELYESYPKEFVDYVIISGIQFEDGITYSLFYPGEDDEEINRYIELFLRAREANNEEIQDIFDEMNGLFESHPYGGVLQINHKIANGTITSPAPLKELYKHYPGDKFIAFNYALALNEFEDYKQCEKVCREIPVNHRVQWLLSDCLANQNRYKEAIEVIHDMMNTANGDQYLIYELNQARHKWNEVLIEEYETILQKDYSNYQNRVDLTWAYLQNDYLKKAYNLADTLEKEKMDDFDYDNLMSNLAISKQDFKMALYHTSNLIKDVEALVDDGNKKTQKRMRRLPEFLCRKANCLLALKREKEAIETYEQALTISSDDGEVLSALCSYYLTQMDYEKAEHYASHLVNTYPESYHGYLLLAYAYYYQERDREAFDMVNESIDIYNLDLEAFILKARILIRNNSFDGAEDILLSLEENGFEKDPSVLFCKGLLYETRDRNYQEAFHYYIEAQKYIHTVGIYDYAAELYYRILWIFGMDANVLNDKDYRSMMHWISLGLKERENHYGLLDYKAWLLTRRSKFKEALKIYKQLEQIENHSSDIEEQIGYIYYQTLEKDAKTALQYYLKSIAMDDCGSKRFYAGMCELYLGNLKEAEQHFLRLQELNPDSIDSYYRLSIVYQAMNENEKALKNINKTIQIMHKRGDGEPRYYFQKVKILRRMSKCEEAVNALKEMAKNYKIPLDKEEIIATYCQFAKWDKAKEWIEIYKKDKNYNPELEIRMYICLKEFDKAKDVFHTYSKKIPRNTFYDLSRFIARIDGDLEKEFASLLKLKDWKEEHQTGDIVKVYMDLAICCYRLGYKEEQEQYAKWALRIINKMLKRYELDHTIYYARKALVLSLLHKKKQANESLEIAKNSPLCDFCVHQSCKDADIYEVRMQEFFNRADVAKQLADAYTLKWPDEESFVLDSIYYRKG